MLGQELEACENFTRSLDLNHDQPYVYFRRAQSLYNTELYTEALADLDRAVALGFKKDEEQKLRMMIVKKIDSV